MINRFCSIALFLCLVVFNQCQQSKTNPVYEKKISFKKQGNLSILNSKNDTVARFEIEIADTPYKRETGLMYRDELATDKGMLFVFKSSGMRNFLMKNTILPLDLIFINQSLEIEHIHTNAEPFKTKSISSQVPAQYVLEIYGGQTDRLKLKKGMKINFNRL